MTEWEHYRLFLTRNEVISGGCHVRGCKKARGILLNITEQPMRELSSREIVLKHWIDADSESEKECAKCIIGERWVSENSELGGMVKSSIRARGIEKDNAIQDLTQDSWIRAQREIENDYRGDAKLSTYCKYIVDSVVNDWLKKKNADKRSFRREQKQSDYEGYDEETETSRIIDDIEERFSISYRPENPHTRLEVRSLFERILHKSDELFSRFSRGEKKYMKARIKIILEKFPDEMNVEEIKEKIDVLATSVLLITIPTDEIHTELGEYSRSYVENLKSDCKKVFKKFVEDISNM